jgi:hypothetical protein
MCPAYYYIRVRMAVYEAGKLVSLLAHVFTEPVPVKEASYDIPDYILDT